MSRTVRNRRYTPYGWVVRDSGVARKIGDQRTNLEFFRSWRNEVVEPKVYRKSRFSKECKSERKQSWREYRNLCKHILRCSGDDENIPRFRKTEGWRSY